MSNSDLKFTRIFSSRYSIEKCAFSPNGRLLATCFGDFSVRVFTIEQASHAPSNISIHLKGIIRDHKSNVWCIAFSNNSALLCTCSSDKTARIWDVQTLECKLTFTAHNHTVWCCGFAPEFEGRLSIVATGSSDLTVKVWKVDGGDVVCDLTGYEDAIDCLDFTTSTQRNDRTLLCTACRDCTIKVWDIPLSLSHQTTTPICLLLYKSNGGVIGFCKFIHRLSREQQTSSKDNDDMSQPLGCRDHLDDNGVQSCSDLLVVGGENNSIIAWDVSSVHNALDEQLQLSNKTETAFTGNHTPQQNIDSPIQSSQEYSHSCSDVTTAMQLTTDEDGSDFDDSNDDDTLISSNGNSELESSRTHSDESEELDKGDSKSLNEQSESTLPPILVINGHTNIVWDCCSMHTNSGLLIASVGEKPTDLLISCSGDRTIRLWDLADGSCLSVCTMPGEDKESQILTCSLCSSQGLLAIGLYNGTLLLGFVQ